MYYLIYLCLAENETKANIFCVIVILWIVFMFSANAYWRFTHLHSECRKIYCWNLSWISSAVEFALRIFLCSPNSVVSSLYWPIRCEVSVEIPDQSSPAKWNMKKKKIFSGDFFSTDFFWPKLGEKNKNYRKEICRVRMYKIKTHNISGMVGNQVVILTELKAFR